MSTAPAFFPTGSWSATRYTSCDKYDSISALSTDSWDVLGHHTTTAYDATQGQLPTTVTDVDNNAVATTGYSYDGSGNPTVSVKKPGETGSYTSRGTTVSTCTDSSTFPCLEVDANTSFYSSAVTRTFYDSLGRKVETLTPGPDASHTIVTFTVYNDAAHSVFESLPFRVASRTTWLDPNGATDDTGATPGGTSTVMDAMGSTVSTTDALSNGSSAVYGLGSVSGDSNTYEMVKNIDANSHVQVRYMDALGRTRYVVTDSGKNGGTLTPIKQVTTQYNALDKPTSVVVTDLAPQSGQTITSVTTTNQYDDLGRVTGVSDPDRGTHTYTYNADNRVLTDVSGTRTIGISYDLLERARCIQDAAPTTDGSGSCSSGSHPLVQNTYDTSTLGIAGSTDFPVGQLTQSIATTYYTPTDYTNKSTVTQQFQHDQRGQSVATTVQVGVPSTWGVTTSLPTYKQTQTYNNADQPMMTQTTAGASAGYTFSQAYDSTTGQLTGLSNNGTGVANLATHSFNPQGMASDVNFQTTTGTQLATDHFGFDADLRPSSTTATWQSGSGATGTIFSSSRAYDAVGNVTSVSNTQATISGLSGSGGSEVQNFCYDEQNRLLWAGNGGTQPGAGNGTCGSITLANSLSGAGYSNSTAYTNLGQIWQGPLNGSGTAQQYLYCDSAHPHQLKGLYPTGTTCGSPTGATYTASYDAWGNLTSRTYNATTATLTYDVLDHLVAWNAGSTNQEWYAYDASGNRVLRRSTTGSGTSITTYAFGLEEHLYGATGINTGNTYYYYLGGRLIGALTGITTLTTQFFLTDALGSVLATFSATAGSAAVLGNQVYGPYGNQRYTQGSMGTAKGYTGQYADATGLDYYNARYYDPVVGRFVSADTVQGNEQGMDPYAYVMGNPETNVDPTGHFSDPGMGANGFPGGLGSGMHPCLGSGGFGCIEGIGGGSTTKPTPTHRSSSVSAGHGNPKIVKSTQPRPSHSSTTKSSGNSIKNWGRLISGAAKIIVGVGTIVASFLSFTNPVLATIETIARFALKNAVTAVVWVINDGIRDVVASFTHVDPVVRVWTDIAAVALDIVAVVLNVFSVINFVKTISVVGTFAKGMQKLAEGAQAFIKSGGKAVAMGPLLAAKVDILSVNTVSNVLGFAQLESDFNTLTDDWAALPK